MASPSSSGFPSTTSVAVTPPPNAADAGPFKSFTEAFSFVKKTEFYSPPPPIIPPAIVGSASAVTGAATIRGQAAEQRSVTPPVVSGQVCNAIVVSKRQKGNPVLKHIRNARWIFGDIMPDYLLGQNSCALYLSLRYHLLHPDYLYYRIRELPKGFRLRVILCFVDVEDVIKPLHEVTKTALVHECTLLCAWRMKLSCVNDPWRFQSA
eukprot:c24077_g1_i4 orf=610-1233(-)